MQTVRVTWMRNPNQKSEFQRHVNDLQHLDDEGFVNSLNNRGYDGILLLGAESAVVGHVFFQRHRDCVQSFSFFVHEDNRRQGNAITLVRQLLYVARESKVHIVRLTAGGSKPMLALWEKIRELKLDLPCIARPDINVGWVELKKR
jgi:GNAT superfamily N-acetyltransferase